MHWPLPPDIPWPQFLRLLRQPSPPKGWLEAAADLEEVSRKPLLLRWIAQHRKAPAHLRLRLLGRMNATLLAAIAEDASAHPQARSLCMEKLQATWTGLTIGEKKALARHLPRPLWPLVWRTVNIQVIGAFLEHPRLGLEMLLSLIQAPMRAEHAEALLCSRWRELIPVASQVIQAMDKTFALPECNLVLGHAAPWIRILPEDERIYTASRLVHPSLRRMTRGL